MSVNAEAGNGVVIERYSLNCKIGSLGVGCREDVRGEYIATGGDTLLDTETAVWCAAFEDGCFGEDVSDCVLVSCT